MIITLLAATFVISLSVALLIAFLFRSPVRQIMNRVVAEALGEAWVRYITLAIVVVGVSGGVQVWNLEKYLNPPKDQPPLVLNADRWVLEIYRAIIGTAQSITWMLLVFFAFALIAYVMVRNSERSQARG
ncbi:MAG: hypothetical protein Q8Q85_15140 [Gemmatimonadales bacterium]|nr:hypothetical protein [Gemmatimonadales bacterium]